MVALLLSAFATAQSSNRVEVFGGYTYMNPDFSLVSGSGASGWNASANFKARRWIGIVADVSGFYPRYTTPPLAGSIKVSGDAYTFLFGPQVSLPHGRFTPFARFLIGAVHVTPQTPFGNDFESDNALSYAAGGGLDYSVTRRIAIRGQVDWLRVSLTPIAAENQGESYGKNRNVARISSGVVFRF
jgi:opacity protein-like surface antigen